MLELRKMVHREEGREDEWKKNLIAIIKGGIHRARWNIELNREMLEVRFVLRFAEGEKGKEWKLKYGEMLRLWQSNNESVIAQYALVVSNSEQSIFCQSESE